MHCARECGRVYVVLRLCDPPHPTLFTKNLKLLMLCQPKLDLHIFLFFGHGFAHCHPDCEASFTRNWTSKASLCGLLLQSRAVEEPS